MKGLLDYIHKLGLKAGLYSSPGPWTCGGCPVGFFNLGVRPEQQEFNEFKRLSVTGSQHVGDLWQQKDLPNVDTFSGVLSLAIPAPGVVLYNHTAIK